MANIYVDFDYFNKSISAIESYIGSHKARMNFINLCITDLNSSWQGSDYDALKQKWEEMNDTDSTSEQMLKALEAYADSLRYAAELYCAGQQHAVSRASGLRSFWNF